MTISWQVQQQIIAAKEPSTINLFAAADSFQRELFDIFASSHASRGSRTTRRRASHWTGEEHGRFLRGLDLFPSGPWKEVAAVVGTKTTRQMMTHAQKYRQKRERRAKLAVILRGMAQEVATPEPQHQQQQQHQEPGAMLVDEQFEPVESFGWDPMCFTTASPSFTMDGCVDSTLCLSEYVHSGVIV